MKRTFFLFLALTLVAALALPGSVQAQTASAQPWTSSIYYYNPDAAAGTVSIDYYDANGVKVNSNSVNIPVASHGSGEIFIGDVNLAAEFKGSAVLSASVPVVAVYEQAPSGADVNYGRLLYSAFDISQGSQFVYIPSFINNVGGYQTQVGVQNILLTETTLTLKFYDNAGTLVKTATSDPVKQQSSLVFTGETYALGAFDGSVVIDAGSGGSIVAAAEDMQTNGRRAYAFEGVSTVASRVYVPSMMCKYSRGGQTSTLFVQNTGDVDTNITVTLYNDATRKPLGTVPLANSTIKAGSRLAVNPCLLKAASGKSGSAVIESSGQNLAVIGKVAGSDGLMTSFSGRTAGSTRTILPYVVWSANAAKGYRSFISIMNAGSANATDIKATYYKPDGSVAKTVTLASASKPLAANYKVSSNPQTAAALRPDASYRGAVEITSDQPVVVIIRLEKNIKGLKGYSYFGEDYTGIPYAPE